MCELRVSAVLLVVPGPATTGDELLVGVVRVAVRDADDLALKVIRQWENQRGE